ncbi:hypothetical protein PFISCL1PPCAC_13145, partial [Pristionchus fissidentatus]
VVLVVATAPDDTALAGPAVLLEGVPLVSLPSVTVYSTQSAFGFFSKSQVVPQICVFCSTVRSGLAQKGFVASAAHLAQFPFSFVVPGAAVVVVVVGALGFGQPRLPHITGQYACLTASGRASFVQKFTLRFHMAQFGWSLLPHWAVAAPTIEQRRAIVRRADMIGSADQ